MTKKIYFMLFSVMLSVTYLSAQVVQTVNVPTAGGLATAIGSNLKTVTDLTLTGTINATDFNTIKQMTVLKNLDMSKVAVADNSIPAQAFQGRVLNSLVLPTTITSIGNNAFSGMQSSSLDLTQIPNLEKIGIGAFGGIVVPVLDFSKSTKLKSVSYSAFANAKLNNMVLDFSNCPNLSEGDVNYYANGAFTDYTGHVILPKAMTRIFKNAFYKFYGTVDLPKDLVSIGSFAFASSKPAKPLVLPSTITSIEDNAFSGMQSSSLDLTQIPNLEKIGIGAFGGIVVPVLDFSKSTKLKSVSYSAFANAKLNNMVLDFSNCPSISAGEVYYSIWGAFSRFSGHVILPKTMTHLFDNAFANFLGTVDLPQGLVSIGNNAFLQSKPAKPLVLPSTITSIGNSAFSEMQSSSLDLTQLPNLETIGTYAFNGIVVPVLDFSKSTKLKRINFNAFVGAKLDKMFLDFSNSPNLSGGENYYGVYGAFSLFSGHVILHRTMTHLFDNAFSSFLGTVDLPQGLQSIGNNAFARSKPAKPLILPSTITSIGGSAFSEMQSSSLDLTQIPNLEKIESYAFNGIVVPELDFSKSTKLKRINFNAFVGAKLDKMFLDFSNSPNLSGGENYYGVYGAFSLFSGHVTLSKTMTHLFDNAFANFLGTVDLPQGLISIGNNVFRSSTISSIEIPSMVKSIGYDAFNNATKLSKIISNNPTPPTLGSNVFLNVNKETTTLEVPSSSINLYGTAAQWKDFLNIKVGVPSKLDLTYKITSLVHMGGDNWSLESAGSNHLEIPYQAVRIGEYYWMNTNFNHKEPKRQNFSANPISLKAGDENNYPLTQAILDKYLDQVLLDKSKFQVDIDQFTKDYGSYYSFETRDFMKNWGRIYESGNITKAANWKMPVLSDVRQLLAMSPFSQNNVVKHLNHFDVMYALNAKSTTNEMSKYIVPGQCGSTYWFNVFGDVGGNKYGFNLMPNGARQQEDYHWNTVLCPDPKKVLELPAPKGHIFQIFYIARFTTQNGDIKIHDQIEAETVQGAWQTVRWCRVLSDEELGYKLYINIPNINKNSTQWNSFVSGDEIPLLNYLRNNCIPTDQASIIKLGLNESVPSGYIELPHGYLRGFYVQYILDKPTSEVTVGEVIEYAYNVEDSALQYDYKNPFGRESLKVCSTTTRSLESEDVVVPFKADASVTLYPNPVQDVLNISGDGVEKVTIYDMSGRQVSTAKNVNTISVSDLSKGTYLVRVLTANGESTHKVIKK